MDFGFGRVIFFAKKWVLSMWDNFFLVNFDHLFSSAYQENLSQILVGLVFCWFGGFYSPSCQKVRFWLRRGKIFSHQIWKFIVFSLHWKYESILTCLSFGLIMGPFTLFLKKIGFWLRWVRKFGSCLDRIIFLSLTLIKISIPYQL